jgi:hypothetical protein
MTNITNWASNNLCPICGGNHDVLLIPLETGNVIIPLPFFYERTRDASKLDNSKVKKPTTKCDTMYAEYVRDFLTK